jgi:hypothetical protein
MVALQSGLVRWSGCMHNQQRQELLFAIQASQATIRYNSCHVCHVFGYTAIQEIQLKSRKPVALES